MLQAVMAGMVEDCNRYFRKVQEHERNEAKSASRISELVAENTALQAELEMARKVALVQSAELNEYRNMREGTERDIVKRFSPNATRDLVVVCHALVLINAVWCWPHHCDPGLYGKTVFDEGAEFGDKLPGM